MSHHFRWLVEANQTNPARCRCTHLRSEHGTDRKQRPTCFGSTVCGCTSFTEPTPPRIPEHLRTDDIQDYLRQKGEIQ